MKYDNSPLEEGANSRARYYNDLGFRWLIVIDRIKDRDDYVARNCWDCVAAFRYEHEARAALYALQANRVFDIHYILERA